MINRFPIKEAEFIISKDELGYQEVLDDFNNTDYIFILTYNISKNNIELLNYLANLDKSTTVDIITNIPNRFESYYNQYVRNRAKDTVRVYLNKLDPKKFDSVLSTYFNFENHAKIVMTKNVVYIGSSNFSDESRKNVECGIITRDIDFIKTIRNEIIPYLKIESEQYYSNDLINSLQIEYKFIYYKLIGMIEEVRLSCHSIGDHQGRFFEYFDLINNTDYIETSLDRLSEVFEEFENICEQIVEEMVEMGIETKSIEKLVEDLDIESIQMMYSDDTNIFNLINFDNQDYAMDYINEYEINVDPDEVDEFRNSASQVAYEKECELEEIAKTDVLTLFDKLNELKQQAEYILNNIPSSINKQIDNT
ncbi:hypothetical protein KHA93_06580 [Bacillus sp. FJAT-49732]|uniref:PLD phosphodiesterase domain-containing protein n=1 Tax=Lederbergia citrisecunda TaxID=2833583 RepID=A0A942TLA7_9BACI|nr:phospholipase D-like domain-containing protein [Lederbergia citrisecunda]MBS4199318.1 hypothetical protein [Lederbergia citrisecunda]